MMCGMGMKTLLIAVLIASGLASFGLPEFCRAETIAVDHGIAVKDPGIATPARGMKMSEVAAQFGNPVTKVPAIGKPPISRWEYQGFVVYFEYDHVIHTVVAG
jgi:hypothetical protein